MFHPCPVLCWFHVLCMWENQALYMHLLDGETFCHLWSYVCVFWSIIPPPNPLMVPSSMSSNEGYLLPHILVWNPLLQLPTFSPQVMQGAKGMFHFRQGAKGTYVWFSQWNIGQSICHGPRLLHEMNYVHYFAGSSYVLPRLISSPTISRGGTLFCSTAQE